jgi:hypothetical protein
MNIFSPASPKNNSMRYSMPRGQFDLKSSELVEQQPANGFVRYEINFLNFCVNL